MIAIITAPRIATGHLYEPGVNQSSGSQYKHTMFDATGHLSVLAMMWYDIASVPPHKDQNTNRQALRAVHLPTGLRFQVEMHIQCGTVEVGRVGEEKAHMAVIGGRVLRRAS
jgi:hypothetical protein